MPGKKPPQTSTDPNFRSKAGDVRGSDPIQESHGFFKAQPTQTELSPPKRAPTPKHHNPQSNPKALYQGAIGRAAGHHQTLVFYHDKEKLRIFDHKLSALNDDLADLGLPPLSKDMLEHLIFTENPKMKVKAALLGIPQSDIKKHIQQHLWKEATQQLASIPEAPEKSRVMDELELSDAALKVMRQKLPDLAEAFISSIDLNRNPLEDRTDSKAPPSEESTTPSKGG